MEIIIETPDKGPIDLEVSPNCDIAGLRKAIKNELGEDSDFSILYWGEKIEDETLKLKDFELGFVDYQIEYPTASPSSVGGQILDSIHKPHKVQISSDKEREIICPQPGRTPTEFFAPEEIDDRTVKYQLTSAGFKELYLFIGDPKFPSTGNGEHKILKFKIPRGTQTVFVKSDPTEDSSNDSNTFTLICQLEATDAATASNVKTIPFKEGTRHSFFDADNEKVSRWKKYVLPVLELVPSFAELFA